MARSNLIIALSAWLVISCGDSGGSLPTACEISNDAETSSAFLNSESAGKGQLAQSIQFSNGDQTLTGINVKLNRVGNPTGDITLVIKTDLEDKPNEAVYLDGTTTGNSATLAASSIDDDADNIVFYTFTFTDSIDLQEERTYWVELSAAYPVSSTNENVIAWYGSSTDEISDGKPKVFDVDESMWRDADAGGDFGVEINCDSTSSVVTSLSQLFERVVHNEI